MQHGVKKQNLFLRRLGDFVRKVDRKWWILGGAVALILIATLVLLLIFGGGGHRMGSLEWQFRRGSGTLTIRGSGSTGDIDWTLDNPDWAKYATRIEHVVVEEGVTELGSSLFDVDCLDSGKVYAIRSVELPASLERIGECAF